MEDKEYNEFDAKYLPGVHNRLIRYYYYLEQGLNIFNDFRYLFLAIAGVYFALQLTNILWAFVMTGPSLVILTILGYYNVHKFSKVKDWISTRFSTHYGIRNFDFQKEQVQLLKEIKELLKQHGN